MNIYEMYGRLSETKIGNDGFIQNTLELLGRIRDGEVDPKLLVVTDTGWHLKEPDADA